MQNLREMRGKTGFQQFGFRNVFGTREALCALNLGMTVGWQY